MTATADILRVGLRFDRSEKTKLEDLALRVKADDLTADVATFEQAALAADTGEPLEVICTDIQEVVLMVAGYVRLGIKQPVIEELRDRN